MSEVLVIVVIVVRFLPNDTMSALQWTRAFAVISVNLFEVFSAITENQLLKRVKSLRAPK